MGTKQGGYKIGWVSTGWGSVKFVYSRGFVLVYCYIGDSLNKKGGY